MQLPHEVPILILISDSIFVIYKLFWRFLYEK